MKIFSFAKSLLHHFSKDQVLEDLRASKTELTEIAAPTFKHASEFFRSNKFTSDSVKNLQDKFYDKFDRNGRVKQSNFITEIENRIQNLIDNVDTLETLIEEQFEQTIVRDGLTSRKAIMIRSAEHMSFLSRMSIDILNYVYTMESKALGIKQGQNEMSELSPSEIAHVERNIGIYALLLSDYSVENKSFASKLGELPEVYVNESTASAVTSLYKESDLDPFKSNFLPGFVGNPIYHVRLILAQWQTARYDANKNKKKMLELRLLHLELLKDKKADAKVEQEIDYIRGRISKIERYMRDQEESVEAEV